MHSGKIPDKFNHQTPNLKTRQGKEINKRKLFFLFNFVALLVFIYLFIVLTLLLLCSDSPEIKIKN